MSDLVPIIDINAGEAPEFEGGHRLAVLLPTYRWNPMARAIIASLVGVASDEIAVLVADNSENPEKREFLSNVRRINPNVFAVQHKKNLGALGNFFFLYDWCAKIPFCASLADDDWMSPTYHEEGYRLLLASPGASCASAGTTLADFGDNRLHNIDQPSMRGETPFERMKAWSGEAARITMYNASVRANLSEAIAFMRETPLIGLTFNEDLWELGRLAHGDFVCATGSGSFIHYPAHGSRVGDSNQRFYELLCKGVGLQYPFVYFTGLATAVLIAIFLMDGKSPVKDETQRVLCGQHVFGHVYRRTFLPKVTGEGSREAAEALFSDKPEALEGFRRYTSPDFAATPAFDRGLLEWFIELLRVFETPGFEGRPLLSDRFIGFCNSRFEG